MQNITTKVFWDIQDPNNIGWAYRTTTGNHEESGPTCDDLPHDTHPDRVLMTAASELGIDPATVAVVR